MAISSEEGTIPGGLTRRQAFIKRLFDLVVSGTGLAGTFWLIAIAWVAATVDTRSNGFFIQERVGMNGKRFRLVKLKTMRPRRQPDSTVTRRGDPRVTAMGRFFRRTKLDELPQLWNVLLGHMSLVGPRPDVPGYADCLQGEDRMILSVRPGITGPATLAYRDEESILANQSDPQWYNDHVIFPDKVRLNVEYIRNWRFQDDLRYIWRTVVG